MANILNYDVVPIVVLVAILLVVKYKRWFPSTYINSTPKNSPPSPQKLPIIGNLHQLRHFSGTPLHRTLQALSKVHGPLMLLHLGSVPLLVVSSAEAAREIMQTHDRVFASRAKSTTLDILSLGRRDIAFAPYSANWRQLKAICAQNLLSPKKVREFRRMREEETKSMINSVRETSRRGGVVDLRAKLVNLTNDVVSMAALGKKCYNDGGGKEFVIECTELAEGFHIGDFIPWLGWIDRLGSLDSKLVSLAKRFDQFLDEVIQERMDKNSNTTSDEKDQHPHEDNDQNKDFVDVLLEIQHENSLHTPLDRTSLKAVIMDMFMAGTDTTHTLMEWAMGEVIKHPKVMRKLQKELRAVKKGEEEILTEDDLVNMCYLKAVIKETLRLHPPLSLLLPRLSMEDVKLKGYDITTNTQVWVNVWQIGRDSESFSYKPEEFVPERFLEVNSDINFKGTDFEFTPFGAGRRKCPGIQFATSVNEIALANLMHKFDWKLPGRVANEDLDLSESFGFTTHMKYPLKAMAIPYSQS